MLGARWLMTFRVGGCAREQFDAVFVHMNADWVYPCRPCWRALACRLLWTRRHGHRRLHRAHEQQLRDYVDAEGSGSFTEGRIIGRAWTRTLLPAASRPETATIVAVCRVSRRKRVD